MHHQAIPHECAPSTSREDSIDCHPSGRDVVIECRRRPTTRPPPSLPITIILLIFLQLISKTAALVPQYRMPIYMIDKNCNEGTGVQEVTQKALSGIVLSHYDFGQKSYGVDKMINCIISLSVPHGYRIRLTALDMDIATSANCQGDALTMFNHESGTIDHTGPLIGKVCGTLSNMTREAATHAAYRATGTLAESKYNRLTVWWHRSGKPTGAKGFKLVWTAFKDTRGDPSACRTGPGQDEFRCADGDCVFAQLVCDTLPHCDDASDTAAATQRRYCGRVISTGRATSLPSGMTLALACLGVIVGSVFCCVTMLICYRSWCPSNNGQNMLKPAGATATTNATTFTTSCGSQQMHCGEEQSMLQQMQLPQAQQQQPQHQQSSSGSNTIGSGQQPQLACRAPRQMQCDGYTSPPIANMNQLNVQQQRHLLANQSISPSLHTQNTGVYSMNSNNVQPH